MHIVPVLDLMGGRVVRGVGGRRAEYRPVASRLSESDAPLDVARAFRARFGLTELYLADLDAVMGGEPAFATYAELKADGFRVWIDAGVRAFERVRRLAEASADGIVVGLETVAGPAVLAEAWAGFGERIIFSLDLKEGKPLGASAAWTTDDAEEIAARAVACGVRRLIVLDLARVGGGAGTGTEGLCGRLAATHPGADVIVGGGVRGPEDLQRLRACGVRTALVASALHDARLTCADWVGL